jgi:hypothetical protein
MQRFAAVFRRAWPAALILVSPAACGQERAGHPGPGGPQELAHPAKVEIAGEEVVLPMGSFGNRPLVEVKIGGKGPFPFVLDTGASGSVISAPFAEAQKLPVIAKARVLSPGSQTTTEGNLVRVEGLQIGGATVSGMSAVAMDLSRVFPGSNDPVGVLSAGLFPGFLLTFDYPAKRIVLRRGELSPANGADVFEFSPSRRLPALPVSIAGVSVELDLDTGSPGGFTVPTELMSRVPISGDLTPAKPDRRVDRVLEAKEGKLKGTANIGRFTFENPTIRFVQDIPQGLIGWEILRRFAVTFDRKNHRLRLAEPS